MTEVFEFEEESTIEATFQIGVTAEDHGALYNRDAPDQHPISAITDLQTTLDGISGDVSAETTRAEGVEGNLENLTTDSKVNLVSAINEVDSHTDTNATNLSNHIADKNNPHEVTKAQVGLGNCDNTSDLDKPISTATQNALNLKVNTADLGNAELDIQKNGTSVGKFTANASTDKVINLVIPTQASDVNALPDSTKYGASISLTINSSTFVVTAQLKDQDGNNLGSAQTIDLPLESVVVNGSYDSVNKKIVLTLENGNTIDIPIGDLVAGLQSEITVDNKLASDLVDDTNQTHKFATSAQLSQIATNTGDISSLQSGKQDTLTQSQLDAVNSGITSAKVTQYDGYATSKANVGLDNLNSDGQMIIDSVDGKISNCILEIPQNIKCEISGTTITLKNGCIIPMTGSSTYTTVTLSADASKDFSSWGNAEYFVIWNGLNITLYDISVVKSGSSLPASPSPNDRFFLTTDYSLYYGNNSNQWVMNKGSYPLAKVIKDSNGVHFAKDSNGNDMIFNGVGFVGDAIFTYPNIKGLIPNGFNADGSLKSTGFTTTALTIITSLGSYNSHRYVVTNGGSWAVSPTLNYVKEVNRNSTGSGYWNYISTIEFDLDVNASPKITNFTIRQPVRTATTEMLDKKQDTLTFDTTPTQSSTNPVTSGGVYTALGTKQDDVTTLTGYDSTKTQTLKNVNGTLTWVDD